ncbi:hypothetical protein EFL79_10590 [Weissella confusa]|nr:hypothetical protein [Weissella confusa]
MKKMQKIVELHNHLVAMQRLGNSYVGFKPGDEILVTEKLDGANGSFDKNGVYSHRKELSKSDTLRGLYGFIMDTGLVSDEQVGDYQVFGEWLVPHAIIEYKPEVYSKFYIFDMWSGNQWVGYDMAETMATISDMPFEMAPKLYEGKFESYAQLEELRDKFKTNSTMSVDGRMEGIVVTNLSREDKNGNPLRIKVVNEDYKEQARQPKHSHSVPKIVAWAEQYVTPARIEKKINEAIDEEGVRITMSSFKDGTVKHIAELVADDVLEEAMDTPIMSHSDVNDYQRFVNKQVSKAVGLRIALEASIG